MIIDKEFKDLIPPLRDDEYEALEQNIIANGCRDALVTWNDILIDGHNRYEICTKHNIPFNVTEMEFPDRNEAIIWAIDNQLGRRNVIDVDRIGLAKKKAEIYVIMGKENQSKAGGYKKRLPDSFKDFDDEEEVAFVQLDKSDKEEPPAEPKENIKPVDTRKEVAKMANVSTGSVARYDYIEKNQPELLDKVREGKMTLGRAYNEVKKKEKQAEIEANAAKEKTSDAIDIFSSDKKYRVIYADPPWSYNDKCSGGGIQSRGADGVYPTMPLQDICDLPVRDICEKNAVLFLWVTSPLLEESFDVISAWGFKYKASFIWDKVNSNLAHYTGGNHEFLLIATRGSCTPDVTDKFDSVQVIKKTEHSVKPEEFRDIIDTLYPIGNRLEMFARRAAEGWDVWGNEV